MRIGIYSGTFDPVHKGHIAFALEAATQASLDAVYFAPEIKPRRKHHVTHFAHRLKMLELAVRSQPKLKTLELPDANFSVSKTMPRIRAKFPNDEIVLLLGSDLFLNLKHWPNYASLIDSVELVVGLRSSDNITSLEEYEATLRGAYKKITFIQTSKFDVSASKIRNTLIASKTSEDLTTSVTDYALKHWLYHDIKTIKR